MKRFDAIYDSKHKNEDNMIIKTVHSFMTAVSQVIRETQPLLCYQPKLVGSARERTRPYRQDELDYLLICENVQVFLDIQEVRQDRTRVTLRVK